jgi:hypothetical protein
MNPEANSDAIAPVKSKIRGVGPHLESGENRNDQRDSAEQFPDSQDDQEIWRIAQAFDEVSSPGHSQDIPYASQNQFEDDQSGGYPVSNDVTARSEGETCKGGHCIELQVTDRLGLVS